MRYNANKLELLLKAILCTFIMSFFFFPIGIKGLAAGHNTKQLLGVLGVAFFIFKCVRSNSFSLPRHIVISFVYACAFSIWCFLSTVINNTTDYAYANYYLSFLVWLGGAYGVCEILRLAYGRVTLSLVTQFLTAACLMQCAAVLLVDNVPVIQNFVDSYILQDGVAKNVHRLYGLGCSLDSGGVRMCCAMMMIAYQISANKEVWSNARKMVAYIMAFLVIFVVGNMIARTTSVGGLLALFYIFLSYAYINKGTLSRRQVLMFRGAFWVILIGTIVCVYLYNTSPRAYRLMRFAFESFFSLAESGKMSTSSTDLLNTMWHWPTDERGWIFGYGVFSEWGRFGTDIGYCRFTNYCGLVGLFLFSIYFMYNASVVARRFENARLFSLFLLALTFVIWVKVSTDIFQLYALLFCAQSSVVELQESPEDA